jgi:3D (Asp-Asp-Asp) domain-containing protein
MNQRSHSITIKIGLVISVTVFAAVVYVNCYSQAKDETVQEQVVYGPMPVEQHLIESGCSKLDTFIVTAYLAIDEYENRFHGITFSGVPAQAYHTVAVDPDVVPLGSIIYIEGLGWWKAEDTGNLIKGKRLDICVSSREEAMRWGVRKREIWYSPPENIEEQTHNTELAAVTTDGIG